MMALLAPTEMAQTLHETNTRLRFWLDSLIPDRALSGRGSSASESSITESSGKESSATELHAATPEQMAGLLSELMRAGQSLRALPGDADALLHEELSEYRKHVERLRVLMPSIHSALLRERARIEQERARLQAAAEWAQRSRETL